MLSFMGAFVDNNRLLEYALCLNCIMEAKSYGSPCVVDDFVVVKYEVYATGYRRIIIGCVLSYVYFTQLNIVQIMIKNKCRWMKMIMT